MSIVNIPISKKPKYIVVTTHNKQVYFHYKMDSLETLNKICDIGFWRIKYKETETMD